MELGELSEPRGYQDNEALTSGLRSSKDNCALSEVYVSSLKHKEKIKIKKQADFSRKYSETNPLKKLHWNSTLFACTYNTNTAGKKQSRGLLLKVFKSCWDSMAGLKYSLLLLLTSCTSSMVPHPGQHIF